MPKERKIRTLLPFIKKKKGIELLYGDRRCPLDHGTEGKGSQKRTRGNELLIREKKGKVSLSESRGGLFRLRRRTFVP